MRPKTRSAGRKLCPLIGNAYSTDILCIFFQHSLPHRNDIHILSCPKQESLNNGACWHYGLLHSCGHSGSHREQMKSCSSHFCFHAPSTHRGGHHPSFEHCLYLSAPPHQRRTCTAAVNNMLDLLVFLTKPSFVSCQNKELKIAHRLFLAHRRKPQPCAYATQTWQLLSSVHHLSCADLSL